MTCEPEPSRHQHHQQRHQTRTIGSAGSWSDGFSGPEGPQALFAGRVLPFDEKAALAWARLTAEGKAKGRPRSPLDMIIAAIAEANDCVVVTENERDFAGLKIVNPLQAS